MMLSDILEVEVNETAKGFKKCYEYELVCSLEKINKPLRFADGKKYHASRGPTVWCAARSLLTFRSINQASLTLQRQGHRSTVPLLVDVPTSVVRIWGRRQRMLKGGRIQWETGPDYSCE